jgi:hypothetical protein
MKPLHLHNPAAGVEGLTASGLQEVRPDGKFTLIKLPEKPLRSRNLAQYGSRQRVPRRPFTGALRGSVLSTFVHRPALRRCNASGRSAIRPEPSRPRACSNRG